jgi:hypothetical protein
MNKFKFLQIVFWMMLIMPFSSNAQERWIERSNYGYLSISRYCYGVKFGPSFNQFSQPGSFIGFNLGLFTKYKVSDVFSPRIEILYSTQGGARNDYTKTYADGDPNNTNTQVTSIVNLNPYVTFNSIEVPLLGEFSFPEMAGLAIQPKMLIGGSYSRALSIVETKTQRYNYSNGSTADIGYSREDVSGVYNPNQISAIAGLGLQFATPRRTFNLELRYRQGLTQLNNYVNSSTGIGGKLYSSSLIFNVSVTFRKERSISSYSSPKAGR